MASAISNQADSTSSAIDRSRVKRALLFQRIRGTRASDHLNLIRGLAALEVVCFHLRGTFFVDLPPDAAIGLRSFYFLTSLGHHAVMVFFVLSGFLIGGNVLRGFEDGQWNWTIYLINRFARLYIVLVPALFLGIFWDHLGIAITGSGGIYGGLVPNASIATSVLPALGWRVLLGNLLFLQTILVPNLGSNGPLWSLSCEFWYYLMFPFMVIALWPGRTLAPRLLSVLAFAAMAVFAGYSLSRLMTVWLIGAGLNFLPRAEGIAVKLWCWIALGLFLVAMIVSSVRPPFLERALANEVWVGGASALLIYAVLQSDGSSSNGVYARMAAFFAGFSYTLYLVHLPLMVFIKAFILPHSRWMIDVWSIAASLAILGIIVTYAWAISLFTEAKTATLRDFLMALCVRIHLLRAPQPSALVAG